jgi:hypothetical protein
MAFDLYTTNNVRERAYPTKSGQANDNRGISAIQANGKHADEAIIPTNFPSGAFRGNCYYWKKTQFGDFLSLLMQINVFPDLFGMIRIHQMTELMMNGCPLLMIKEIKKT